MGRPGLTKNRKFSRLVRELEPACKKFAEQVARGSLELIWDNAYECGDDYLGDADDVEASARWKGPAGVLCKALLHAGGEGEAGFIHEDPQRPDHYIVHDLYHHAPAYVKKRMDREAKRQAAGQSLSDVRSDAARRMHEKQTANEHHKHANENHLQTWLADRPANEPPPSPTPAPAPAPDGVGAGSELEAGGTEKPAAAALLPEVSTLTQALNRAWPGLRADPEAVSAWGRAHVGVDLLAETPKAYAHWVSNVGNRKAGDLPVSFLNRWFGNTKRGRPLHLGAGNSKPGASVRISEQSIEESKTTGRKFIE